MDEVDARQALFQLRRQVGVIGEQPLLVRSSAGLQIGQVLIQDTDQVGDGIRLRGGLPGRGFRGRRRLLLDGYGFGHGSGLPIRGPLRQGQERKPP